MKYIGIKKVDAQPSPQEGYDNGEPGYNVTYADGYTSWCPKGVFEKHNIKMQNPEDDTRICLADVDAFIANEKVTKLGDKTTVVTAILKNGYEVTETSSCVDAANYDEELGANICRKRIQDKVWMLLGFLLQCSKGVNA